jgi:hypothetical protein
MIENLPRRPVRQLVGREELRTARWMKLPNPPALSVSVACVSA